MTKQTVGHKNNKELLKIATANGGRVVYGKNHILIYDGNFLVVAVSYGGHKKDRVPGGMKGQALRAFKKRGWRV
jgi:hypothetical protein